MDIKKLLDFDKRVLAQAISKVEDGNSSILREIYRYTGRAYYVGLTGPPGAGKSTLLDKIAHKFINRNKKECVPRIGIIAVDPTSPFSGGALLGDRIRMSEIALLDNVFIRSMATRGSLGGLAKTTKDVALLFDAAGMDYIFIETIGVGQVELDIADVCDTTIVVLVPESGDSIQALKAGLLEIADIIVVNKADRPAVEQMVAELKFISGLRGRRQSWAYPIVKTIAIEGKGIDELVSLIGEHKEYLTASGYFEQERKHRIKIRVKELIEATIMERVERNVLELGIMDEVVDKIYQRTTDPFRAAEEITENMLNVSC